MRSVWKRCLITVVTNGSTWIPVLKNEHLTSAAPSFLPPFSFQSITFLLEVQWRIVLEIELQSFPSVKIQTQITWRVHTWSQMPTHDVFFSQHEPNVPEADDTHRRTQTPPLWLILENLPDFGSSIFQASPDIINISNRCYEASLWPADVALRSEALFIRTECPLGTTNPRLLSAGRIILQP